MTPTSKVAALVLCAGISFGFGITSIVGVLDSLRQTFGLDLRGSQCLVFVLVAGCFLGAALAGPIARRMGRRPVIAVSALLAVTASALLLASPPFVILVIARIQIGISVGLFSMAVPMYAAEATPASVRGAVLVLFQVAITGGILLAYSVALYFDHPQQWHWILGAGLAPNLATGLALLSLPESPSWLRSHGRNAEARVAALRLGISESPLKFESDSVANQPISGTHRNLMQTLSQGRVVGVVVLCSVLFALQNLSGIDAILYYAPEIFRQLGFSAGAAALGATCGLGAANFIGTLVGVALVDRAGRRLLWIGGSALMAFGLATVVAAAHYGLPWLGLAGLCIYIVSFAVSLGPLPYVMTSELVPGVLREQGIATASAVSWLFNAAVALIFLSVVQVFGLSGTMLLFLAICLVSVSVGLWWLPETRHVPLDAIEARVLAGHPLRDLGLVRHPQARPENGGLESR